MSKRCSKCRRTKPLSDYPKDKKNKDGLSGQCRDCVLERERLYRAKNRERRNELLKKWRINNPDKAKALTKKWCEKRNSSQKRKLNLAIGGRIRKVINNKTSKRHLEEILGYSAAQLRQHIEQNFKNGMTWENRCHWHVDHKIPVTAFSFETIEDTGFKKCWSLDNLQPMWAKDNIRKSNKCSQLQA